MRPAAFAFVAASMFYPAAFGTWFGADLKILIVPLIQVITFGMGTTLSGKDFGRTIASVAVTRSGRCSVSDVKRMVPDSMRDRSRTSLMPTSSTSKWNLP